MSIKRAFSLTELLIVLVILAILFAATMPIVTKRKMSTGDLSSESVWNYVDADINRTSYYSPGANLYRYPAVAYIGLRPDHSTDTTREGKVSANSGKVTIKSEGGVKPDGVTQKGIQRQIQFRYGEGNGILAGTLFVDHHNLLLGGTYDNILTTVGTDKYEVDGTPVSVNGNKAYNTILGLRSIDKLKFISQSTIIGNNSMAAKPSDGGGTYKPTQLIAIGNNSANNEYLQSRNTFVGNYSGGITASGVDASEYNVAVGYSSLPYRNKSVKTSNNVFLGYNTGGFAYASKKENGVLKEDDKHDYTKDEISNNVVIGSPYLMRNAKNNTIIGMNTMVNKNPELQNVTAIGYNACGSVDVTGKNITRTCIGYNSAYYASNPYFWNNQGKYYKDDKTWDIINSDGEENKIDKTTADSIWDDRIFIGSNPAAYATYFSGTSIEKMAFPGRSVIEIHNIPHVIGKGYVPNRVKDIYKTPGGTVIFNSNLAVRGKLYTSYPGGGESGVREKAAILNKTKYRFKTQKKYAMTRLDYDEVTQHGLECTGDIGKPWPCHRGYFCSWKSFKKNRSSAMMSPVSVTDLKNETIYDLLKSGEHGIFPYLKTTSDIRLKENIKQSNIGLADLIKIKPYHYTFKSDKTKTPQVGVIAQDLIKIFPKSVTMGADGYYRIRWDEMFYSVINAIKALNAKIEKIASNITNIENSLTQVSGGQKSLKKRIAELNSKAARLERK